MQIILIIAFTMAHRQARQAKWVTTGMYMYHHCAGCIKFVQLGCLRAHHLYLNLSARFNERASKVKAGVHVRAAQAEPTVHPCSLAQVAAPLCSFACAPR